MISLLHLIIFFFFALDPLPSSPSPYQKPDCPARCGNVTIPYPFGIGSGCSLESSFNITCNTSTTPPKPYLNISDANFEVVEIRIDNPTRIRIRYPYLLSGVCYNLTSGNETREDGRGIFLWKTQYTLSENNWLTTIGCDDFGAENTLMPAWASVQSIRLLAAFARTTVTAIPSAMAVARYPLPKVIINIESYSFSDLSHGKTNNKMSNLTYIIHFPIVISLSFFYSILAYYIFFNSLNIIFLNHYEVFSVHHFIPNNFSLEHHCRSALPAALFSIHFYNFNRSWILCVIYHEKSILLPLFPIRSSLLLFWSIPR